MLVRTRSLIAAQRDAQEAEEAYLTAVAHAAALAEREKRYAEVRRAAEAGAAGPSLSAAKLFLEAELVAVSQWPFLAFHEWILTWVYANGLRVLPDLPRPRVDDMSLVNLLRDVAL